MSKGKVTFQKLIQDSQDYSSFDKSQDHMVSTIHFILEVEGNRYDDMTVEVRQPYGTNYETEPIEVSEITGSYKGAWNHHQFADLCEDYYRMLIGSSGHAIRVEGARNVRMRNNTISRTVVREIETPDESSAAW